MLIHHGQPLSLESVDVDRLVGLATGRRNINVVAAVGDTVIEGMPLLHIFNAGLRVDEKEHSRVLELGESHFRTRPKICNPAARRYRDQGIVTRNNHPTTAVRRWTRSAIFCFAWADDDLRSGISRYSGRVRLVIPFPSWDYFLHLAFEEILSYGARSVQVMCRMKALIADLLTIVPLERRAGIRYWQERLQGSIAGRSKMRRKNSAHPGRSPGILGAMHLTAA